MRSEMRTMALPKEDSEERRSRASDTSCQESAATGSAGGLASTESPTGLFAIASMDKNELQALLSGHGNSWRSALFSSPTIARDQSVVPNPVQTLIFSASADTVEITENRLSFYRQGDLVLYASECGNDITVMPFTWITASNNLVSLAMKFEYHPEAPHALIREVSEDRHQRIYDMYRQLWLGDVAARSATEQGSPETNVFESSFVVEKERVRAFNRAIGYGNTHAKETEADDVPVDFAISASWRPISQALLQDPIQGDLLTLVHLSNSHEAAPGAQPLEVGDELVSRAYVNSITIDDSGKTVEVACEIRHADADTLALTVRSRFLFRGNHDDFSSTFSRSSTDRFEVKMNSARDLAVLASKPWFHRVDAADINNAALEFHLQTFRRFKARDICSSIETTGKVFARSDAGELSHVADVSSQVQNTKVNPVVSYLLHTGKSLGGVRKPLAGGSPVASQPLTIVIPDANETLSDALGDVNPAHTSPMFSALVSLPGTMARNMHCSAAVRGLLEKHVADKHPERVGQFGVSFVGTVLPGDELKTTFTRKAMSGDLQVIGISVRLASTGIEVISGEAVVSQPAPVPVTTPQSALEKSTSLDLQRDGPVLKRAAWHDAEDVSPDNMGWTSDAPARKPFRRPRMGSFRLTLAGHLEQQQQQHGRAQPEEHNLPGCYGGMPNSSVEELRRRTTRSDRFRGVVGSWDRWIGRAEAEKAGLRLGAAPGGRPGIRV